MDSLFGIRQRMMTPGPQSYSDVEALLMQSENNALVIEVKGHVATIVKDEPNRTLVYGGTVPGEVYTKIFDANNTPRDLLVDDNLNIMRYVLL